MTAGFLSPRSSYVCTTLVTRLTRVMTVGDDITKHDEIGAVHLLRHQILGGSGPWQSYYNHISAYHNYIHS